MHRFFEPELFICCSLLVTFCSSLVTFCSLFFHPNYREMKLLWTAKKWFVYNETLPQIFFFSEILVTLSAWWFSKFSQHAKPLSKLTYKVTNIPWTGITLMSLLQYLDTFYLLVCTWRARSSCSEEFYENGVLKYFTKFTEKHLRWGIFCNKAASWWPGTSLNTESGTDVFSVSSLKSFYKNIYFANVSKGMPLKSKIFSGVSFRKTLGIYCKRKRQLFNYEGISLQTLKIPELVNRIIFCNSSELLLIKVSHQAKTCSMSTKKECFRNVILVSLWLAGEYFWRLWRSLIFVNLQVFI